MCVYVCVCVCMKGQYISEQEPPSTSFFEVKSMVCVCVCVLVNFPGICFRL